MAALKAGKTMSSMLKPRKGFALPKNSSLLSVSLRPRMPSRIRGTLVPLSKTQCHKQDIEQRTFQDQKLRSRNSQQAHGPQAFASALRGVGLTQSQHGLHRHRFLP